MAVDAGACFKSPLQSLLEPRKLAVKRPDLTSRMLGAGQSGVGVSVCVGSWRSTAGARGRMDLTGVQNLYLSKNNCVPAMVTQTNTQTQHIFYDRTRNNELFLELSKGAPPPQGVPGF